MAATRSGVDAVPLGGTEDQVAIRNTAHPVADRLLVGGADEQLEALPAHLNALVQWTSAQVCGGGAGRRFKPGMNLLEENDVFQRQRHGQRFHVPTGRGFAGRGDQNRDRRHGHGDGPVPEAGFLGSHEDVGAVVGPTELLAGESVF